MKRFTLFTFAFLGIFTQTFLAFGQTTPFISGVNDPATRTTTFQTQNLLNGSGTFYIFGDGHFSMQNHPVHQYRKDDNFGVTLYAIDPYTVTPPAIFDTSSTVSYSSTGVPPGSSTANFGMSGKTIRVDQSWNAADNYDLVLIVTFTHPDATNPNAAPIDGEVDLYLDQYLTYSGVHYTSSDWAIFNGASPTGIPAIPNKVSWTYTQLKPGEIRHVYAEVNVGVMPPSKRRVKAIAELIPTNYNCGLEDCVYTDINRMPRTDKPKDPNRMFVKQSCIKALSYNRQILDYEVHFYNEGKGPAKDVVLEIDISMNVQLNDVNIKDSSDPCFADIDPTTGKLIITFPQINLPGLQQIHPRSYFFNETTGFVDFSICSEAHLHDGLNIDGVTDILFDIEPPVQTNWVHTMAENPCPLAVPCGLEEEGEIEYEQGMALNQNTSVAADLQISPNPFSDELQLNYSVDQLEGEMVSIYLMDISGTQVRQLLVKQYQGFGKQQQQFDLSGLPAGIYLLSIQQANQIKTRKLVKLN